MQSVRLESVSKLFGDHRALSPIDLTVSPGERIAVLGPSGAGKTTLLRLIAGLEKNTTGKIFFGELDVSQLPPNERKVAMVFQDYAVYPQLTVAQNLKATLTASRLSSAEKTQRIEEALDWFRLTELAMRRPAQLSGGQLQRVALAKAVIGRPSVMLLDEPFSQLDMHLREQLRELLVDLHERFPSTMILVTHDPMDAMRIASRIAILDSGNLIAAGPGDEVYRSPVNRTAANLISPFGVNWIKLKLAPGVGADGANCLTQETLHGLPTAQQESSLEFNFSEAHFEKLCNQFARPPFERESSPSFEREYWLGFRPESVRLSGADVGTSVAHSMRFRGRVTRVQSLGFSKLASIATSEYEFKGVHGNDVPVDQVPLNSLGLVDCHVHEDDLLWFPALPAFLGVRR